MHLKQLSSRTGIIKKNNRSSCKNCRLTEPLKEGNWDGQQDIQNVCRESAGGYRLQEFRKKDTEAKNY